MWTWTPISWRIAGKDVDGRFLSDGMRYVMVSVAKDAAETTASRIDAGDRPVSWGTKIRTRNSCTFWIEKTKKVKHNRMSKERINICDNFDHLKPLSFEVDHIYAKNIYIIIYVPSPIDQFRQFMTLLLLLLFFVMSCISCVIFMYK